MRSNEASDSWHRPVSWNFYNKALDPGYDLQIVTDLSYTLKLTLPK